MEQLSMIQRIFAAAMIFSAVLLPLAAQSQTNTGQQSETLPASNHPAEILKHANKMFEEKSYQLALDQYQQLTDSEPTSVPLSIQREAKYKAGLSLQMLGRTEEALKALETLTTGTSSDDVWAGRAHWKLEPALGGQIYYPWEANGENPERLHHLRKADKILSEKRPADLPDFYFDVVTRAIPYTQTTVTAERKYLFSFYDKLLREVANDSEKTASALMSRALNAGYVEGQLDPKEKIRQLEMVVSEFPQTTAARQAQLAVANEYMSANDLVPALAAFRKLSQKWPSSDEGKQASAQASIITRPEIDVEVAQSYRPSDPLEFLVVGRNVSTADISIIRFHPDELLRHDRKARFDLPTIDAKPVQLVSVSLKKSTDYRATTTTVVLNYHERGTYVLRAKAGNAQSNALLVISDLVLVSNASNRSFDLWTASADDGKPRPNCTIIVATKLEQRRNAFGNAYGEAIYNQIYNITSNENGFAELQRPMAGSGQNFLLAYDGQGNWAMLDNVYWYGGYTPDRGTKFYGYSDRPVYRPGQKVNWRFIIRDEKDGKYVNPSGATCFVTITDQRGNKTVPEKSYTTNEFGAISDTLSLTQSCPLGAYNVQVTNANRNSSGNFQFRVEEYKKPEFEVSVSAADTPFRIGAKVSASVNAKYYFGAPVSDATIQYTVRRRPRYIPLWELQHFSRRDELDWFDKAPQERGIMHGSGGEIVATGKGRISADGKYQIEFSADVPPDQLRNETYGYYGWWYPGVHAFDFQIEATVTDKSRRNVDASKTIIVSEQALLTGAATQQRLYSPGDIVKANLSARTFNDEPAATSGTLYVEHIERNEVAKKDDITTLSIQHVDIGTSGELLTSWRIPEQVSGDLRLLLLVHDPFGKEIAAYSPFTVADANSENVYFNYSGLQVIADKEIYERGETAKVLILNEFPGCFAWYWVDTGMGSFYKKILPLPNRVNFVSLPVTEALIPNCKIHVVSIHDKRVISDEVELIVPPKSKVLNVLLRPDKESYKPGEEATFDITATDSTGQPVLGEFSLSVFDNAITYIAPEMREDIRHSFYGTRRTLSGNIQNSVQVPSRYNIRFPDDNQALLYRTLWWNGNLAITRSSGDLFGLKSDDQVMYKKQSESTAAKSFVRFRSIAASPASGAAIAMDKSAPEQPALVAPNVRKDFRDSMYWTPAVLTDDNGKATVKAAFPDSLTTWKAVAVGTTTGDQVGNATTTTIVQKNILVRLEAPRFFRERDKVTLSGIVHNYLPEAKQVHVTLDASGVDLDASATTGTTVLVQPGSEKRVDWNIDVKHWGEAVVRMQALTDEESDAVEMKFPVLPHGIDKFVAWNGSSDDVDSTSAQIIKRGDTAEIRQPIEIPEQRIISSSKLTVSVNASLASVIKDALPYLTDYPYGCVEQTMSRFMPATVALKTFEELNIPRDPGLQQKLLEVTGKGLERLQDFQHGDGGWGWWKDDNSDPYMTAYAVYGLSLAAKAGVDIQASMLTRGLDYIRTDMRDFKPPQKSPFSPSTYYAEYWPCNRLHSLAYESFVLAIHGEKDDHVLDYVLDNREHLTAHGLALLARTMHYLGRTNEAQTLLRNLYNFAVIQKENKTARWGRLHEAWYWWMDAVESTSQGLMANLEIAPQDQINTWAMKWLVLNRRGREWKSTKDTAIALLALTSYMKARNETVTNMKITVKIGDLPPRELEITPANFWNFDGTITLKGDAVPGGKSQIVITKTGGGTLFYNVYADYFTLEENIRKAGNEIYVDRSYEKLTRATVTGTTGTAAKDVYIPIHDGDKVQSGDELRVTLKIKSLNDYEYLMFEDPKPAGMEPVALQSGTSYGNGLCSNMELRDQFVSFFITHLPQGENSISYNCRAEIPGVFHTMPTTGSCMYFPPLRANSDELVVKVQDAQD
jgi:uncharacterized protein YfaS (alpha-2-macroglobulin family)/outer membrane protein assembly factor BamD (BamD/ComL family)